MKGEGAGKNRKKGIKSFTLAELLVVVAIIAVLVAVGIPVFVSQLAKTRAAVCMANRRNLYGEISTLWITNPGDPAVTPGAHPLTAHQAETYTCPNKGTIAYTIDSAKNIVTVRCTKHDPGVLGGDTVQDIVTAWKAENYWAGGEINSTAPDGTNTKMKACKEAMLRIGIDLDAFGIKAWKNSSQAGGRALQMTTSDITMLNVGDKILVLQYKEGVGYTVWESRVGQKSYPPSGETMVYYNIINEGIRTQITADFTQADKQDFNKVKDRYNEYAQENGYPLMA